MVLHSSTFPYFTNVLNVLKALANMKVATSGIWIPVSKWEYESVDPEHFKHVRPLSTNCSAGNNIRIPRSCSEPPCYYNKCKKQIEN